MNYMNICQVCCFCRKGSKVFKVYLRCFDDETGELNINPIESIHFSFQCQFCLQTSLLDFEKMCPPHSILYIKYRLEEKKQKMQNLIDKMLTLVFDE